MDRYRCDHGGSSIVTEEGIEPMAAEQGLSARDKATVAAVVRELYLDQRREQQFQDTKPAVVRVRPSTLRPHATSSRALIEI